MSFGPSGHESEALMHRSFSPCSNNCTTKCFDDLQDSLEVDRRHSNPNPVIYPNYFSPDKNSLAVSRTNSDASYDISTGNEQRSRSRIHLQPDHIYRKGVVNAKNVRASLGNKQTLPKRNWARPKRKNSHPVKIGEYLDRRSASGFYSEIEADRDSLLSHNTEPQEGCELKRSKSCGKLVKTRASETSVLQGYYKCDYKLVADDKKRLTSSAHCIEDLCSSPTVQRVYELEETKAIAFVWQVFRESHQNYVVDKNNMEEYKSDEPFIIYKKGYKPLDEGREFTDVQAIDLQKLFDEAVSFGGVGLDAVSPRCQKIRRILITTYDIACSSADFLNELLRRFFMPTPCSMSKQEAAQFNKFIKKPAQTRVISLLMLWMELRQNDFAENLYLRQLTRAFIDLVCWTCHEDIVKLMKLTRKSFEAILDRKQLREEFPKSIINEAAIKVTCNEKLRKRWVELDTTAVDVALATETLLQCSATEFAEQMTLIDSSMHQEVRHWHFPFNRKNKVRHLQYKRSISGEDRAEEEYHNLYQKIIEQTNYRAFFFIYILITNSKSYKKREIAAKLLDIAEKCLKLNNYQGFCCVIGALTNTAVLMQKPDFDKFSIISKQRKAEYFALYNNWRTLRLKIAQSTHPMVPSVLLVAETVEKLLVAQPCSFDLEERQLVNFKLMEELSGTVSKYFESQDSVYPIEPVSKLLDYLQLGIMRVMKTLDCELRISRIQSQLMILAQVLD